MPLIIQSPRPTDGTSSIPSLSITHYCFDVQLRRSVHRSVGRARAIQCNAGRLMRPQNIGAISSRAGSAVWRGLAFGGQSQDINASCLRVGELTDWSGKQLQRRVTSLVLFCFGVLLRHHPACSKCSIAAARVSQVARRLTMQGDGCGKGGTDLTAHACFAMLLHCSTLSLQIWKTLRPPCLQPTRSTPPTVRDPPRSFVRGQLQSV